MIVWQNINSSRLCGFSIVELLAAVAIVGVIATLALPRYRSQVARSRQAEAKTNLGTIHKLQKIYATESEMDFAPPRTPTRHAGLNYGINKCGDTASEALNGLGFRLTECSKSRYRYVTNGGNDCAQSDGSLDQGKVYPGCTANDIWHMSDIGKLTHTHDVIKSCPGGSSPSNCSPVPVTPPPPPPICTNTCPTGHTLEADCSCTPPPICTNTCPTGHTLEADCSCTPPPICTNTCPTGHTLEADCSCTPPICPTACTLSNTTTQGPWTPIPPALPRASTCYGLSIPGKKIETVTGVYIPPTPIPSGCPIIVCPSNPPDTTTDILSSRDGEMTTNCAAGCNTSTTPTTTTWEPVGDPDDADYVKNLCKSASQRKKKGETITINGTEAYDYTDCNNTCADPAQAKTMVSTDENHPDFNKPCNRSHTQPTTKTITCPCNPDLECCNGNNVEPQPSGLTCSSWKGEYEASDTTTYGCCTTHDCSLCTWTLGVADPNAWATITCVNGQKTQDVTDQCTISDGTTTTVCNTRTTPKAITPQCTDTGACGAWGGSNSTPDSIWNAIKSVLGTNPVKTHWAVTWDTYNSNTDGPSTANVSHKCAADNPTSGKVRFDGDAKRTRTCDQDKLCGATQKNACEEETRAVSVEESCTPVEECCDASGTIVTRNADGSNCDQTNTYTFDAVNRTCDPVDPPCNCLANSPTDNSNPTWVYTDSDDNEIDPWVEADQAAEICTDSTVTFTKTAADATTTTYTQINRDCTASETCIACGSDTTNRCPDVPGGTSEPVPVGGTKETTCEDGCSAWGEGANHDYTSKTWWANVWSTLQGLVDSTNRMWQVTWPTGQDPGNAADKDNICDNHSGTATGTAERTRVCPTPGLVPPICPPVSNGGCETEDETAVSVTVDCTTCNNTCIEGSPDDPAWVVALDEDPADVCEGEIIAGKNRRTVTTPQTLPNNPCSALTCTDDTEEEEGAAVANAGTGEKTATCDGVGGCGDWGNTSQTRPTGWSAIWNAIKSVLGTNPVETQWTVTWDSNKHPVTDKDTLCASNPPGTAAGTARRTRTCNNNCEDRAKGKTSDGTNPCPEEDERYVTYEVDCPTSTTVTSLCECSLSFMTSNLCRDPVSPNTASTNPSSNSYCVCNEAQVQVTDTNSDGTVSAAEKEAQVEATCNSTTPRGIPNIALLCPIHPDDTGASAADHASVHTDPAILNHDHCHHQHVSSQGIVDNSTMATNCTPLPFIGWTSHTHSPGPYTIDSYSNMVSCQLKNDDVTCECNVTLH